MLNVNSPLVDLIEKVLNASCNEIISKQVPKKLKDPRSFTISIEIGNIHFHRALCDLGASINLMPLYI
ncbi:Retrovirus-related Pol polyprotein from transposon opus [Gossypium australe]|uniref:Retrovirus-related Pol polyprotein from transposon opus n=1 Tax=Gossypium australe TaxID=47621 RepID=A0A5B6VX86_9ROSI|nr:Retrovirus-related Pol polyprotein from transposon opus [Gossypium australe]